MARRFDDSRWVMPVLLLGLLLACFGRLAADPSALIVDADRPSIDHNRRPDDPPTIGNDATRLFLPHHAYIARQLARLGRVPTWDDRGFGGRPLVGNPQAGLFYPPHWLAWRLWTPSILGWLAVVHLFWAGIGTYFLARSIGLDRLAATVAAGCFQASPYVLAQTFEGHYPHVYSASWMPWAFLAALGLRRGRWRSGLMLVPILALAGLAGHPQEAYYLAIALAAWGLGTLFLLIRAGQGTAAVRLGIMAITVAALTVGVSAVEWLPDVLAARWTLSRSTLAIDQASRYHLFPLNALQLLGPFALGRPGDYFGHDNYWEALTSIGLIPLSLAIAGAAWSPHREAARGWIILVLASLAFAAGRELGLFTLLYQIIPGLDRFRVPSRSLFLASLGAAILAGMGVDALRRPSDRLTLRPIWFRRASTATLALAIVVVVAGWSADRTAANTRATSTSGSTLRDPTTRNPGTGRVPELDRWSMGLARLGREPAFWLALGGVGLSAYWARWRPGDHSGAAAALGILGLFELGLYGHSLIVTAPVDRFLGSDPIGDAIERDRPTGRGSPLIRAVDSLYDDFRAGHRGFRKTNVNDSFQIQHAADLYESLYRTFLPDRFDLGRPMDSAVSMFRRDVRQSVLDRMGVEYLVANQSPNKDLPWPPVATGRWGGSDFTVYRNPSALPRAYVVPRVEIAPDGSRMIHRFRSAFPKEAVLMDCDPPMQSDERQDFRPAKWRKDDPDDQSLEVSTQEPGLLVISDTWMPGWEARIDGAREAILRGNRSQKVIPLPTPKTHDISMKYHAPGLPEGSLLTLTAVTIWLILFAKPTRQCWPTNEYRL